MPTHRTRTPLCAAGALLTLTAAIAASAATAGAQRAPVDTVTAARNQTTTLISRSKGGGLPNAPSTNPVLSNDKRYQRAIAFESEASNLGPRDNNRLKDVYVVLRGNRPNNKGTSWKPGKNLLMSRTRSGKPADGPSYSPSIDGSFHTAPKCVGFLSDATNMVAGDKNGQPDAFFKKIRSGKPKMLKPRGRRPAGPATAVAVSGNCKLIAFVIGGKLYVSKGGRKGKRVAGTKGTIADPQFSTGLRNDLVYGGRGGVYLSKNGTGRAQLVGRGGRNPAYNDIKNRVVTFEKRRGGHWQIYMRGLGKVDRRIGRRTKMISDFHGRPGNGDSRDPVIGNSGFYVTFETDASNLQSTAAGSRLDDNRAPDSYLYTDTRHITLLQSVSNAGNVMPGGGANPGMSFYANYIVFDSPAPLGSTNGGRQIYMRWLGGI